jgi:hypothetical protein
MDQSKLMGLATACDTLASSVEQDMSDEDILEVMGRVLFRMGQLNLTVDQKRIVVDAERKYNELRGSE